LEDGDWRERWFPLKKGTRKTCLPACLSVSHSTGSKDRVCLRNKNVSLNRKSPAGLGSGEEVPANMSLVPVLAKFHPMRIDMSLVVGSRNDCHFFLSSLLLPSSLGLLCRIPMEYQMIPV
jgi:hypothetical protein